MIKIKPLPCIFDDDNAICPWCETIVEPSEIKEGPHEWYVAECSCCKKGLTVWIEEGEIKTKGVRSETDLRYMKMKGVSDE